MGKRRITRALPASLRNALRARYPHRMRTAAILAAALALGACAASAPRAVDPAPGPAPADRVDYRCEVDADCTVKDIGNCCGRYLACVNRASPTFPERVRQVCAEKGLSGVCGWPDIQACRCVAQRCNAVNGPGGNGAVR